LTALLIDFAKILLATSRDVLPIIVLITFFQLKVVRRPIPHLRRLVVGCVFVVIGLALFLAGLEKALFPLGKIMAAQLSDPAFIYGSEEAVRFGRGCFPGRLEGLRLDLSFWGHNRICNHNCRTSAHSGGIQGQ
jgi:hypothetical protein